MIQQRDTGDENDTVKCAVQRVQPLCPRCGGMLPWDWHEGVDINWHTVTCRCGQVVSARFYVVQA